MNHPETIIRTLDGHLLRPTRLILYGRAAIALGFNNAPACSFSTLDVDAILPAVEIARIDADEQFWNALEKTNDQLRPSGLYVTHLFMDTQLLIGRAWLDDLQEIHLPNLKHLSVFRPSTEDLILTKMMRVDPQDRSDIEFLTKDCGLTQARFDQIAGNAMIPDIPEIRDAFCSNSDWLRTKLSAH